MINFTPFLITNFPPTRYPYTNVQPFTFRDAISHEAKLHQLTVWLRDSLVPFVNENLDAFGLEFKTMLEELIDNINQALTDQSTANSASINAALDQVNAIVQQIINSSIEMQDPVLAGILNDANSASNPVARKLAISAVGEVSGAVYVDNYPGATDADKWDAAVSAGTTFGATTVIANAREYELDRTIWIPPTSGITIQGTRGKTRIKSNYAGRLAQAFGVRPSVGQVVENVILQDMTFDGGQISDPGNVRARSTANGSFAEGSPQINYADSTLNAALAVWGDLTPYVDTSGVKPNPYGIARNITVRNVELLGLPGLPVFFQGVRGHSILEGSYIRRCLDPGWVYCESAQFINNRSEFSMDNGASLSRGCIQAVATGNSVYGAWFNGIWVGGFKQAAPAPPSIGAASGPGPRNAVVTGNTIDWARETGVFARDQAGDVTISGNTITRIFGGTDDQGIGIWTGPYDTASNWGKSVNIVGNTIDECSRGGIAFGAAELVNIVGNVLRNVTTLYLISDPTTTRPADTGLHRFGIGAPGIVWSLATAKINISGNTIVDNRPTPSLHHAVWRSGALAATNPVITGNQASGNTGHGANLSPITPGVYDTVGGLPDAVSTGIGSLAFVKADNLLRVATPTGWAIV